MRYVSTIIFSSVCFILLALNPVKAQQFNRENLQDLARRHTVLWKSATFKEKMGATLAVSAPLMLAPYSQSNRLPLLYSQP